MEEKIKVAQKILLFHKGKLLILQRNINDSFASIWDLPGGKLDFLEKIDDGMKREIKEETGLNIKKIKRVGMFEYIIKEKRKHYLLFLYKGTTNKMNVKISSEHQDYKWIKPSDFFKYKVHPSFYKYKNMISENLK